MATRPIIQAINPTLQQDSEQFMLENLAESGLTPEDAHASYMPPGAHVRHSEYLTGVYRIPYWQWEDGKATQHPFMFRLRLRYRQGVKRTRKSTGWNPRKPPRYAQPSSDNVGFASSAPYMPPGGSGDTFLFCEGEKKLLACMKRFSLPGVAMGGKDNWRDTRVQMDREHLLHPDLLERLSGAEEILLISDGDVVKPHIGRSYRQLANALTESGLKYTHLNVGASIDDYLVANPELGLDDLLDHAADLFSPDHGIAPDEFCEKYGLAMTATGIPVMDAENIALLLPQLDEHAVRFNEDTGLAEVFGQESTDGAVINVMTRLQGQCFMRRCPKLHVYDAVTSLVKDNHYSPLRDWMDGLPAWDGVSRLEKVFGEWCGAERSEYRTRAALSLVGGFIRRTYEPGSFHRNMVILTGPQGVGKTGFSRWLVGDEPGLIHMGGAADLNPYAKKDLLLSMSQCKVWVLDDIDTLQRGEQGALKALVAATSDTYRAPYGRAEEKHPRKCVMVGTTNSDHFLPADKENTRYVPVEVPKPFNWAALYEQRDQVFAEARAIERKGGIIEIDMALHKDAWERYEDEDPFEELIEDWVNRTRTDKLGTVAFHDFETDGKAYTLGVQMHRLASDLGIKIGGPRADSTSRIKHCLTRLGFVYSGRDTGPVIAGKRQKKLWMLVPPITAD